MEVTITYENPKGTSSQKPKKFVGKMPVNTKRKKLMSRLDEKNTKSPKSFLEQYFASLLAELKSEILLIAKGRKKKNQMVVNDFEKSRAVSLKLFRFLI